MAGLTFALQPGVNALQPGVNRQAAQCAILAGRVAPPGPPQLDAVPIGSVEWTREYAKAVGRP